MIGMPTSPASMLLCAMRKRTRSLVTTPFELSGIVKLATELHAVIGKSCCSKTRPREFCVAPALTMRYQQPSGHLSRIRHLATQVWNSRQECGIMTRRPHLMWPQVATSNATRISERSKRCCQGLLQEHLGDTQQKSSLRNQCALNTSRITTSMPHACQAPPFITRATSGRMQRAVIWQRLSDPCLSTAGIGTTAEPKFPRELSAESLLPLCLATHHIAEHLCRASCTIQAMCTFLPHCRS